MREIEDLLSDYLSGEVLSSDEIQQLEEWKHSGKNDKLWLFFERMAKGSALRARLREDPKRPFRIIQREINKKRMRKRYKIFWGVAASIMLCLGITFFFTYRFGGKVENQYAIQKASDKAHAELVLSDGKRVELLSSREEEIIASDGVSEVKNSNSTVIYTNENNAGIKEIVYNTLSIPLGAEYSIILADGTKVYLNSGSKLRFPVVFSGKKREVFLEGEGYFEVAHDSSRQFVVHTENMSAIVLGTSFNIKSYKQQEQTAATLEAGRLKIICRDQEFDLHPGYQILYDKTKDNAVLKQVETGLYTSWKDGYYDFNLMRLEEIMTTLSLWYNLNISYLDHEVKNLEFSGRLKRYDDVLYLLKKFEETNVVRFIIEGNNVVVKQKITD